MTKKEMYNQLLNEIKKTNKILAQLVKPTKPVKTTKQASDERIKEIEKKKKGGK